MKRSRGLKKHERGPTGTLKEGKEVVPGCFPLPQCMTGRWSDLEMAHSPSPMCPSTATLQVSESSESTGEVH